MTDAPISDSHALDGGAIVEAPESQRLAKLAGENARLRSEIRQALTRAQRAEADAKRVRASTKFAVGDLLVKSARNPRRLLVLPRDLLRLYRLRRHRRREPEHSDTSVSAMRARRSDLTDEVAARLLLPRMGGQPLAPLSIAGALDPLTAATWSTFAAVTSVLPHDAATLLAEADPDIAVIDTSAALPLGPWSHLGNPAAPDRALAAHALIAAAKAQGRPVMLLRGPGDNPGFDALAALCDLVVDVPGRPRGRSANPPWDPGIDLGLVHRIRPDLLTGESGSPHSAPVSNVRVHVADVPGRPDPAIESAWAELLQEQGVERVDLSATAPPLTAVEQMLRDAQVIALHGDAGDRIPGASRTAVSALLMGHRLVAPDDLDLPHMLRLVLDADPTAYGLFTYSGGDIAAALSALQSALQEPSPDPRRRWQVWQALFDQGNVVSSWADAVEQLGLGCRPMAVRHTALLVSTPDEPVPADRASLRLLLDQQTLRPREIVCDRAHAEAWRDICSELSEPIIVRAISAGNDRHTRHARAAQAVDSSVLIELHAAALVNLRHDTVADAVLAHELTERHPLRLRLPGDSVPVTVMCRADALHASGLTPVLVEHPGWIA